MAYSGLPADLGTIDFSLREREVIAELARGSSLRQIAERLHIKANTVKDYTKTIYSKAQVHSARQLLLHIYSSSQASSGTQDQGELVAAFDALLFARNPIELLGELRRRAQICTGASESRLWRVGRLQGRTVAGAVDGVRKFVLPPFGFIARLLNSGRVRAARLEGEISSQGEVARGAARVEPEDISDVALCGLAKPGDAILGLTLSAVWASWCGLRADLPAGPVLLLLTRPSAMGFTDGDVAVCRSLLRVAESQFSRLTFSRSASA